MYAISAIFRDDVLNIINSEQLDFDEENDKDNRIKLTLTNSLITSLLIDPELRPVSLITNELETNNDLLGYSEDESLEFALSSSNFKISGDKSHFLKALREYINSVEILHKDFTKKGFEEAIKLNRKASAFLKKE